MSKIENKEELDKILNDPNISTADKLAAIRNSSIKSPVPSGHVTPTMDDEDEDKWPPRRRKTPFRGAIDER